MEMGNCSLKRGKDSFQTLEKAEENAQRLTGNPGQVLPHPELCTVRQDLHQSCPHCQVSSPGAELKSSLGRRE